MSEVGRRIRALRKAKGLTLQDLGDRFGVHRASVHDWEYGYTYPDPRRLVDLAAELNTSIEYILTGHAPWPFPDIDLRRILKLPPEQLRELGLTLSTALTIIESRTNERS